MLAVESMKMIIQIMKGELCKERRKNNQSVKSYCQHELFSAYPPPCPKEGGGLLSYTSNNFYVAEHIKFHYYLANVYSLSSNRQGAQSSFQQYKTHISM